jgi:hypothetical protein
MMPPAIIIQGNVRTAMIRVAVGEMHVSAMMDLPTAFLAMLEMRLKITSLGSVRIVIAREVGRVLKLTMII